jgi:hypothetical protein
MADDRSPDRRLDAAAWFFLAGFLVHQGDHMRRTLDGITDHVIWGGTGVAVLSAVALTLLVTRHRLGPLVAAGAGWFIAVGVSLTHLVPTWSALSDSLPDGQVDAFTWFAVLFEVVGALVLAIVGTMTVLRDRSTLTADRAPATLDAAA